MGMGKGNKKRPIDKTDIEILKILSANARENLNIIAKKCEITSAAALKRIKRMKDDGIIVGTYLLTNKEIFDNPIEATVLIDACNTLENDIKEAIRKTENVIVCSETIGRYNLCSLVVVHDIKELNETVCKIKNIKGVHSANVNIWTGKTYHNFARDLDIEISGA